MTDKVPSVQHEAIDAAARIGLIVILVLYCLAIVKPFITLIMWGGIIAVAFHPLMVKVTELLKGRQKLAAVMFVLTMLVALLLPTVILGVGSFGQASYIYNEIQAGTLKVPPPSDSVADWPLFGESLHGLWGAASSNLESVLIKYKSEIGSFAGWIAGSVGSALGALVKFAFSIIIAGVFLAKAESCARGVRRLANRFLEARSDRFVDLATATIRSVANGVVGVALIQSGMSLVGFLIAGVPLAGLWALIILLLAIMQLPPMLVLAPAIIWVFAESSTGMAVLFTAISVAAGGSDTFLKPLFLGRGVDVPMLVILLGAIGGMILSGIIGLFVGSVMLALGYSLLVDWIAEVDDMPGPA